LFFCLLYVCRCNLQLGIKEGKGDKKICNMEELQPPGLAIWRVKKLKFSIITKYKSKTIAVYTLSIRVQRAEQHRNRSPYEKMSPILLWASAKITCMHTGMARPYRCPYHLQEPTGKPSFGVFLHYFGHRLSLGFPQVIWTVLVGPRGPPI
jgi:hypothetical protein